MYTEAASWSRDWHGVIVVVRELALPPLYVHWNVEMHWLIKLHTISLLIPISSCLPVHLVDSCARTNGILDIIARLARDPFAIAAAFCRLPLARTSEERRTVDLAKSSFRANKFVARIENLLGQLKKICLLVSKEGFCWINYFGIWGECSLLEICLK